MYLWTLFKSSTLLKCAVAALVVIMIITAQEYRVGSKVSKIVELETELKKVKEDSLQKSIISESRRVDLESCAGTLARVVSEVKALESNPVIVEKLIYKSEQKAVKHEEKASEIRKVVEEKVVAKPPTLGKCTDVTSLELLRGYIKERQSTGAK